MADFLAVKQKAIRRQHTRHSSVPFFVVSLPIVHPQLHTENFRSLFPPAHLAPKPTLMIHQLQQLMNFCPEGERL